MTKRSDPIKPCHSHHFKMGKTQCTVTFTLSGGDMWAFYHLAKKYSNGCVPDMVKAAALSTLLGEFKSELEADLKTLTDLVESRKRAGAPHTDPPIPNQTTA